ncbi:hypothetical protein [Flavobacterium sp. U410]
MKQIRTSKFSKLVAYYLAIMMFLQVTQPIQMYALTSGPSQPEFSAFTPIGTSDMVDLASGDFNYNIPIMDVGGYPINLAYDSGVTMDQEASWVGLGWNLNIGQINRQVRGLPDDFDGDLMGYENNMKDNITVGANFGTNIAAFGIGESGESGGSSGSGESSGSSEGSGSLSNGDIIKLQAGLGVRYNNYDGINFSVSGGLSFEMANSLDVGMQMESSVQDGVSASPSLSYSHKLGNKKLSDYNLGGSLGVSYNSRKGVESMTFSPSVKKITGKIFKQDSKRREGHNVIGMGATLSYNPDVSYTPTKRVGMQSSNYMFNMDIDVSIWGLEPGLKFSGFRTKQGIDDSEKIKQEKAYGYQSTYKASVRDILDFNREKDRTVNRNTSVLPMTNYTFDIYSVQGQGVSGMFRPYRSQVGYVFDNYIEDKSNGGSLGLEFGPGGSQEWGFNLTVTSANSNTSLWSSGNQALSRFKKKTDTSFDYEEIYFKNVGGDHVDTDWDLFKNKLGEYRAIKFPITGSKFGRNTNPKYFKTSGDGSITEIDATNKVARENRVARNQAIQVLTLSEAKKFGYTRQFSKYAKNHHTAEIRILKEGGDQYVFGKALYNTIKKEVTFDVSGRSTDCASGLVNYNGDDNSINNSRSGDQYFNRVTTPPYAHTFLLTEILSSDYQDIDDKKGPSDGDLGSYTKFVYEYPESEDQESSNGEIYKWRVPFEERQANYDEGLKSSQKDDKGNYLYGEREQSYIKRIETKTHIAIFELSKRKDGFGVKGENGGLNTDSPSFKLDKIYLYSKPEYDSYGEEAKPIKVAHFVYDYELCQGINNNNNNRENAEGNELDNQGGKLTLKKVYFTYRDSNMGKYTPYVFNYQNNYSYNMKAYDIWGNYKPVSANVSCKPFDSSKDMSNSEFPYVDQNDSSIDDYTSAWILNSVKLPSGGIIEINYESDDYAYVQDKEAMQMFKVLGAGTGGNTYSNNLYSLSVQDYLYIKINEEISDSNKELFKQKYIRSLTSDPVYFRFLLNMADPNLLFGGDADKYDYVTGYLQLDNQFTLYPNSQEGTTIAAIKIKKVDKGDGVNSNKQVNPISKAGWNFGRSYLNNLVYGITNEEDTDDLKSIVFNLIGALPSVLQIFQSPNGRLEDKRIASKFVADKSWIRLMNPDGKKKGGGSRVKEVKLHDQWDVMTGNDEDPVYAQFYGQQYSYVNKDNKSTGVATYEPIGSKENPLVKPFYDKDNPGLLLGPDEQNYVEEPLGESFYPTPKVTYSRVEVRNLPREKTINQGATTLKVNKHATGSVVTEFFTSKDYPTVVDYTPVSSYYDKSPLASLIEINDKQHLTMSQGFSIHTNDMDGKMKSQRVFAENQTSHISGVDYKYYDKTSNVNNEGLLNNEVTTIDRNGQVSNAIVGVDYDVINDFRKNESISETVGVRFNNEGLPLALIYLIVPIPLPSYSRHENILKTAVTTKVLHSTGILRETIAYDAGSVVSTKNLAWDAETGQVLLAETINEYNDKYYSFNYPAYWANAYKAMGQAVHNLGLQGVIKPSANEEGYYQLVDNTNNSVDVGKYLMSGDELWITQNKTNGYTTPIYGDIPRAFKAWVYEVNANGDLLLIDEDGLRVDQYKVTNGTVKVVRSGYRNLQTASMASVTSMHNPLLNLFVNQEDGKSYLDSNLFETTDWNDYRIINTSAIEYSNFWPGQCECNLPQIAVDSEGGLLIDFKLIRYDDVRFDIDEVYKNAYNPYVYNVLGNWRAKKSYAYLTGRHQSTNVTPRISGFYKSFYPYYVRDDEGGWNKNTVSNLSKWTFASEVTQYNPYGQEVENRDALNRYSSALYGYNYRFPLAVASNTKYSELGYDGFEDYNFSTCDSLSHFSFEGSLDSHNIKIANNQSHTGRRSLRVAPAEDETGRKALLKKKVVTCNTASNTAKQLKVKRTIK